RRRPPQAKFGRGGVGAAVVEGQLALAERDGRLSGAASIQRAQPERSQIGEAHDRSRTGHEPSVRHAAAPAMRRSRRSTAIIAIAVRPTTRKKRYFGITSHHQSTKRSKSSTPTNAAPRLTVSVQRRRMPIVIITAARANPAI